MITAEQVRHVAYTAEPHTVRPGVQLTIRDLILLTTSGDWDHGYLYELNPNAAVRIAREFNERYPEPEVTGRRRGRLARKSVKALTAS